MRLITMMYLAFFLPTVLSTLATAAVELPDRSALVKGRSTRSLENLSQAKVTSTSAVKLQASDSSYICSVEQVISDPCLYKYDGVCDAGTVDCEEQSDCFDCDPCLSYLTCGSCVADPACVWCESLDPISLTYTGLCNSLEFAQAAPFACGFDVSDAYSSVCPDKQMNDTGTCDILTDGCLYQFDLVCDSVGDLAVCADGTDCLDCDPCQSIVNEAVANGILDSTEICSLCVDGGCTYCTAPALDGGLLAVCTSPYLASMVPNICLNAGGTSFRNTCSAGTPPPVPIDTNFSASCDYSNDSCLRAMDGTCDAGDTGSFVSFCEPNTDCMDCDPCQQKRYDGCDACVAAGCYWCALDALCLSDNPLVAGGIGNSSNPYQKVFLCSSAEDFTQTCPTSNSVSSLFNDPLYEAESWVYDLIGVQQVWESGITGAGIGIRINDIGVDAAHLELSSKFVLESSCSLYEPIVLDAKHNHGTICASLAAGSGNNDLCSLGIAPNASISSCRVVRIDSDDELAFEFLDSSYLYTKMDNMHVSSNSYGVQSCQVAASSATTGTRNNRRLQDCPFTATDFTGASPCTATECSAVDWSNPSPSNECEAVISTHCQRLFESDVLACTSFLDLFVKCQFNSLTLEGQLALSKGVTEGRNGKGIVYVFAAGNDFDYGADVNFAGWQSSRYAIVVGAIDKGGKHSSYSTGGASLFISAPGGDFDYYFNNAVALAGGTCTDGGVGTSFAAPVVSGVVALVLEANPDLSWRDVQGVLASSATMIQPSDPSWITNAAGLHHSSLFGFGLVNASAAVALSKSWVLLPPEVEILVESGQVNTSIPDFPSGPVTSNITMNASATLKVESVVTYLDLYHSSRGELRIVLKSPSGTESLLSPGQRPENSQFSERWKLTSVAFRDEPAAGSWTLSLVDESAGDVSSCIDTLDWSVNVTSQKEDGSLSFVELSCFAFQLREYCVNGTVGPAFFESFSGFTGPSDPFLANDDGLTPADACCECGGGRAASSLQDQLLSWRLVVYGNDPESAPSPPSVSTPTSSAPQAAPPSADDPAPTSITAPVPATISAPVPITTTENVVSTSPVVRPPSPTATSSGGIIYMSLVERGFASVVYCVVFQSFIELIQ